MPFKWNYCGNVAMNRPLRLGGELMVSALATIAAISLAGCQTTETLTYRQYQAMLPSDKEQVVREVLAVYLSAPELEDYDSCVYAYFDRNLPEAARENYPYIGFDFLKGFMEKEDPRFSGDAKRQINRGLEMIAQTFCRKPGEPFRS